MICSSARPTPLRLDRILGLQMTTNQSTYPVQHMLAIQLTRMMGVSTPFLAVGDGIGRVKLVQSFLEQNPSAC